MKQKPSQKTSFDWAFECDEKIVAKDLSPSGYSGFEATRKTHDFLCRARSIHYSVLLDTFFAKKLEEPCKKLLH
jgi:hypothetical protein